MTFYDYDLYSIYTRIPMAMAPVILHFPFLYVVITRQKGIFIL